MPRLFLAAMVLLIAAPSAFALNSAPGKSSDDRASIGGDITVAEGESVADVACAFCSVRIHGKVRGDVAVLLGSVTLDSDQTIAGDVAILGGDLTAGSDSTISGDVAIAGGTAELGTDATIHGTRTVLPGRAWAFALFAPLLVLVGVIWLIVWLVRRNRYPRYAPPVRRF